MQFLIVYKHNVGNNFFNITYFCDGAPALSEIQLKIIEKHKWNISEFAVINIIPVKTELLK